MNTKSITYFLLWLSKTDPTLISFCPKPVQWSRQALGFFVLATGIFAFLTGTYFIQTMFVDYNPITGLAESGLFSKIITNIIGLFWAVFIIMLDREIVSASSKWGAAIRLPLALALGFAIAIPLKVNFFQSRILKQLTLNSKVENAASANQLNKTINDWDSRSLNIENKINEERNQMAKWSDIMEAEDVGRSIKGRTGRPGRGVAYNSALNNFHLHQKFETQYVEELKELRSNMASKVVEAKSEYESSIINQTYDFVSQYEALEDLASRNSHIKFLAFLITLIFIIIEVVPALLKLIKGSDEYDALLEVRTNIARQMAFSYGNLAIDELQNVKNISTLNQHNYPYTPKEIIHSITLNLI
ncbi:MAG: DUF4407 domain-containing protein [Saprospiraceae bacterium]|nr:DUF4407 domain-containing protein [Saprospiraceae bacterium]